MILCSKAEAASRGYLCQACGTLLADLSAIDRWDLAYQAVQLAWKQSGKEWLPIQFYPLVTCVPGTHAWKIILRKEKTKRIMMIAWEGLFLVGDILEKRENVLSDESFPNYDLGLERESWEDRALHALFL